MFWHSLDAPNSDSKMYTTLHDIKLEVEHLFGELNFLNVCKSDDEQSKIRLQEEKSKLIQEIDKKQTLMFRILKEVGIE